jgi:ribosomal protein S18 acetylase RimI-like enzyme
VSYLDSTAAGMVSATAPEDGTIELISMWVAPFARGRSVGDALLAAVKAWAAEQGAARICLAVFETNAHAIAFYSRHGFTDSDAIDIGGSRFPPERKMVWNLDPKSTAASG